ncbi:hypothetical protein EVA_07688, partial [gut metagenome]
KYKIEILLYNKEVKCTIPLLDVKYTSTFST